MKDIPRIALIHATRVAIQPIEEAAKQLWPEAETISILEESLSVDRAKDVMLTDEMSGRIIGLSEYAQSIGSQGVLFTCSAFGEAIEAASERSEVPVLKPNEAMFDQAFQYGDRVALLYTFEPAAESMVQEFQLAANRKNSRAKISSIFCPSALKAKQGNDVEKHDLLIAEATAGLRDFDVILFAQFSMASAAKLSLKSTKVPILTSPEAAICEMRRRVETRAGRSSTC